MADRRAGSSWLRAWYRAVVRPAEQRASAVWLGSAIVAAIVFGPTGMRPHDLTQLALHNPGVAAVLTITWLLLFCPRRGCCYAPSAATFCSRSPIPAARVVRSPGWR